MINEPPNIKAEPIACSTVKFSCSITTAKSNAKRTCSWTLENLPWFLSSVVLVAVSQAFVYASLAVSPLTVVTPILQLSLVFRLFLSQLINRDQEVMNAAVIIGAFTAVLGSILVSLQTDELTTLLQLPSWFADFLQYRLASH